jgi:hypothetical protein
LFFYENIKKIEFRILLALHTEDYRRFARLRVFEGAKDFRALRIFYWLKIWHAKTISAK